MDEIARVRLSGPLAGEGPAFASWLLAWGYSEKTVLGQVRMLSLLSRWLDAGGLGPTDVSEVSVDAMVSARHSNGELGWVRPCSFRLAIGFLRSVALAPPAPPATVAAVAAETPVVVLLGCYRDYLVHERGLAALTIDSYVSCARLFLKAACGNDVDRIGVLDAGEVARFVSGVAVGRRASTVNTIVVSTRALLRFFYATGRVATPLAQAVPWLARGRQSTLPRVVEAGTVQRLLTGCDRQTVAGARDYALIVLLGRLGLRVGEVLAIELEDLDWGLGEITVRSKGGGRDRLPIPADIGDALAGYLSARGRVSGSRRVFVEIAAPHHPLSRTAAIAVVRRTCARVGIANTSTHRLRHSVARDLLRSGAALPEIAQLLRHQELATTAVYAKVDFAALASVAKPWPGSGS